MDMESSAKIKIWYWVFTMGRGLHLWCPNHSKSRNRCLNLWVKLIGDRPQQSTFTGLFAGLVILYSYTRSWSWSKYSSRNCWWNYCNSNNQVWGSHDYVCLASWQPLPVCTHSGNTRSSIVAQSSPDRYIVMGQHEVETALRLTGTPGWKWDTMVYTLIQTKHVSIIFAIS